MINSMFAGEIWRSQVDSNNPVPKCFLQSCHSIELVRDSGVVDEYIQLSKFFKGRKKHALDCILVRDINSKGQNIAMEGELRFSSLQSLRVDIDDDYLRFGKNKYFGDDFAESACCTGDKTDFSRKICHGDYLQRDVKSRMGWPDQEIGK